MLLITTMLGKNVSKYGAHGKSFGFKRAAKFQQKCL
jgi:hypothetical protein